MSVDKLLKNILWKIQKQKKKHQKFFSDRSGTAMTSATSNQAAISETHFYEELNRRFANEINSVLEKEKGQGHYDNLALISGPEFMGHMRNSMSKNVSAVVSEELVKNVFPMSVNEVKEFSKGL